MPGEEQDKDNATPGQRDESRAVPPEPDVTPEECMAPRDTATEAKCQAARRAMTLQDSFHYAFEGLGYFLKSQRNARIDFIIAVVALVAGYLLGLSRVEFALVILVIGLVIVAEMFNTALEATVDLATEQWHALAKAGKDVGAGAVLVASVIAVVVGLIVYVPHIVALFGPR